MDQPPRTLVAAIAGDGGVHTLSFSDGTVVGYEPDRGRVTRVHQLPADFGPAELVDGRPRVTPLAPLLAALAAPDRRHEAAPPIAGGRRADDVDPAVP
jgi:hypothetical protein